MPTRAWSAPACGASPTKRATSRRPRASCPPPQAGGPESARRLLDQCRDLGLVGLGQLGQRIGDRPHGALVEVRLVAEAERRVPRLELPRGLEMADDGAV